MAAARRGFTLLMYAAISRTTARVFMLSTCASSPPLTPPRPPPLLLPPLLLPWRLKNSERDCSRPCQKGILVLFLESTNTEGRRGQSQHRQRSSKAGAEGQHIQLASTSGSSRPAQHITAQHKAHRRGVGHPHPTHQGQRILQVNCFRQPPQGVLHITVSIHHPTVQGQRRPWKLLTIELGGQLAAD